MKLTKLIGRVDSFLKGLHGVYKLIILIGVYVGLSTAFKSVPYLNVLLAESENRITIVGLLALLMYRVSIKILIFIIIGLLLLSVFGLSTGLAIYLLCFVLLVEVCKEAIRKGKE